MYHAIGAPDEEAARFVLPGAAFAAQMRLLAGLRYRVLRLEEAVRALTNGDPLPRRSIALTFDDGTYDLHSFALPVLERHHFPATAFVVTQTMGSTVDWTDQAGIAGRATMTWDDALSLEPLVTLQPHTRTHASLRELTPELTVVTAGGRRGSPIGVLHDGESWLALLSIAADEDVLPNATSDGALALHFTRLMSIHWWVPVGGIIAFAAGAVTAWKTNWLPCTCTKSPRDWAGALWAVGTTDAASAIHASAIRRPSLDIGD